MHETVGDLMDMPVTIEIGLAGPDDIPHWMSLAEEVLSLFGPMPGFDTVLTRKIAKGQAYCARARGQGLPFLGGVLIGGAGEEHWIRWLAVCSAYRRLGIGRQLTEAVIAAISARSFLNVDTFAKGNPGAVEASHLYESCGFVPTGVVDVDGQVRQRYRRRPASPD
jgi:GNAT superfamily N-acetyltransferase